MGTFSDMTPPVAGPETGLNAAVAAELRAERAAQGLTVKELADASEVPFGTLRRYLAAERHIDIANLTALATALGTTAGELVAAAEARERRGPGPNVIRADFGGTSEPAPTVSERAVAKRRKDRGESADDQGEP